VAFAGFDTVRQVIWFGQQIPPDDIEDDDEAFWRNYWDCEACCYPDRGGDLRSILKTSDFYSSPSSAVAFIAGEAMRFGRA
jgi:hypothetical protein